MLLSACTKACAASFVTPRSVISAVRLREGPSTIASSTGSGGGVLVIVVMFWESILVTSNSPSMTTVLPSP